MNEEVAPGIATSLKEVLAVHSPILTRSSRGERQGRLHAAKRAENIERRIRVAALLLIASLTAGPVATHVYWLLGGTWGLYDRSGAREHVASTGVRIVAAVVVLLLMAAILVVIAQAGFWRPAFVSERVIQLFAWILAAVFLLETLAAFTWSRGHEWWMYGPVSLVIGALALAVAASGGAWPRSHRWLPSP
jgi:cytochrome bd-type quinol oxidase subunit 2